MCITDMQREFEVAGEDEGIPSDHRTKESACVIVLHFVQFPNQFIIFFC